MHRCIHRAFAPFPNGLEVRRLLALLAVPGAQGRRMSRFRHAAKISDGGARSSRVGLFTLPSSGKNGGRSKGIQKRKKRKGKTKRTERAERHRKSKRKFSGSPPSTPSQSSERSAQRHTGQPVGAHSQGCSARFGGTLPRRGYTLIPPP
jgi:hypothetical protein